MSLQDHKITEYQQNIKDLPNQVRGQAEWLKAFFDGRGDNEIKDSINGIIDSLMEADAAAQVGAEAPAGVTPDPAPGEGGVASVQSVLQGLANSSGKKSVVLMEVEGSTSALRVLGAPDGATWADYQGLVLGVKSLSFGTGGAVQVSLGGEVQALYFPDANTGGMTAAAPAGWTVPGGVYLLAWDGTTLGMVGSVGGGGASSYVRNVAPTPSDDRTTGYGIGDHWYVDEQTGGYESPELKNLIKAEDVLNPDNWTLDPEPGTPLSSHWKTALSSGMGISTRKGIPVEYFSVFKYGITYNKSLLAVQGHKYYLKVYLDIMWSGIDPPFYASASYKFGGVTLFSDPYLAVGAGGTPKVKRRASTIITANETNLTPELRFSAAYNFDVFTGQAVFAYPIVADLTETFGAGNEWTLEQCDAFFAPWEQGWFDSYSFGAGEAWVNMRDAPGSADWRRLVFESDVLVKGGTEAYTPEGPNDPAPKGYADEAAAAAADGVKAQIVRPNLLINGGFDVAQRGDTVVLGPSKSYGIDMWANPGTFYSTQTRVENTSAVPGKYALRITNHTAAAQRLMLINYMEDAVPTDKKVCISFGIRASEARTISVRDGNNSVSISVTTEWTYHSIVFDGFQRIQIDTTGVSLVPAGGWVEISPVKAEIGELATEYVPPKPGVELAECQRYLQKRSTNNVAAVDVRPSMRIDNPTITAVDGGYLYSAEL